MPKWIFQNISGDQQGERQLLLRKMRSTMGEKKNEVHLVTDGHDKKLNPKQPFFNLSSQPAAEKGRLSVKHNRVKFFLK